MSEPEPVPEPEPEPTRSRKPVVIAVVAAFLVLATAVAIPVLVEGLRDDDSKDAAATLDDVRVFKDLHRDHTEDDVDYDQAPPAGGAHDPVWLDCGAYDTPVRDENAVHDLEHGAVWISYDPDLGDDDVAALAEALPDNGILAPYDGLESPVVVTVWQRQLELTGADDPRLGLFIAAFGDGHTSPEPFASCEGGTSDADGSVTTQV